ncbi:MAG: hypothetical protein ACYCYP_10680 [Leptospirales bacterium]
MDCVRTGPGSLLTLDQVTEVRLPLSAAISIAVMIRCTATASSKFGAELVPLLRSFAILA